jgi:hypothetical protein
MILTAGEFLNYCKAGLTLVGRNEEGELEWVGTDKQWTKWSHIEDGVYHKCAECKKEDCECDNIYQESVDNNL